MQTEAIVGRPPLPEGKKRKNRMVALFTDAEKADIDANLEEEGEGINDLIRRLVLSEVRNDTGEAKGDGPR